MSDQNTECLLSASSDPFLISVKPPLIRSNDTSAHRDIVTDGRDVLNMSRGVTATHTLNHPVFKWSLEQKYRVSSAEPAALLQQEGGRG